MAKVMECRCIQNGLVVYRFKELHPPPEWHVVDEVAKAKWDDDFRLGNCQMRHRALPTLRFMRQGVEVDSTGTWVRYDYAGQR